VSRGPGLCSHLPEGAGQGHYAQKQLGSRSRLIAWSHRRRLEMAARLAAPYAGRRLLDYGCGDGTFLAYVSTMFPQAVGADADARQIEACRRRFADLTDVLFVAAKDLNDVAYEGAFDLICCMEVLEHCLESDAERLLRNLSRLLAPAGLVIISVPIEVGPALLANEFVRAIAGWRRIGDYQHRDSYRFGELMRMLCAGNKTAIPRPAYPFGGDFAHSHKGFNWRTLRSQISRFFVIREVRFSPIDGFSGWLSSQVWFRCDRLS
jgi:2-polyprenyl-3-methyl-5-hydroxy-6-metoxy-1,4-benzoquinol methylase